MSATELTAVSTARVRGTYARLYAWLTHPNADRVICWLAFVLLLASLGTGLSADDYLHSIMLDRPSPMPAFQHAPLDLFRFCDPARFQASLEEGIFSWWDDPHTKLRFMRPVSAITHIVDHALFRNQDVPLHLHSALWTLLLFFGVRALYRALIPDRLLANLALAIYALDDGRGWLVSWVAARNAAIATGLSVWTLVAHDARRSGRLRFALGPLLFVLALLASEGSSATFGYLLGYALFLERGALRERLMTLTPYLGILIVWRVVYRALDFGAYGSGLYVDFQSEPIAFIKVFLEHAPVLLAAQFGGMWSDVWTMLFVAPHVKLAVYCVTCLFVGWVLWLMWPQLRTNALARFSALGALVSLVPATSVSPIMDRLLTWVAIGASILMAQVIAPWLRQAGVAADSHEPVADSQLTHRPQPSAAIRASVALLVALQLVSVVLLASRARGNLIVRDTLDRTAAAVPKDPSITDKTLIYVNPPLLPNAAYMPIERAAQGIPRPRAMNVLAVASSPLHLDRIDAHTLRLRPRDGFLIDPVSKLLWSEHHPFHVGEQIVQGDLTVTVLRASEDHRPLEIEARFARPLEDPSYVWVDWQGTRSVPFTPPAVGEQSELESADYAQVMLGFKLPFPVRL